MLCYLRDLCIGPSHVDPRFARADLTYWQLLHAHCLRYPLLLAIFGFRSRERPVLIGMAGGALSVFVWRKWFSYTGMDSLVPGILCALVFFMGSHYILREEGGWVGIKHPGPLLAARQARRDAWKAFWQTLRRPRLYAYLCITQRTSPLLWG